MSKLPTSFSAIHFVLRSPPPPSPGEIAKPANKIFGVHILLPATSIVRVTRALRLGRRGATKSYQFRPVVSIVVPVNSGRIRSVGDGKVRLAKGEERMQAEATFDRRSASVGRPLGVES